jgi:hypothetical protein
LAVQVSHGIIALTVLGVLIVVGASVLTTLGVLSSNRTVQSRGAVKTVNVGAYWNSICTNTTTTIDWGMLSPGTVANVSFYVRNEGNLAVKLGLTSQNWSPVNASSYMSLSWNREGQTLALGNVTLATLSLNVSSSISGITNFSFDTVIIGSEL